MMRRPVIEDIETAIAWLQQNEGDDGEKEACSRVATWLGQYANNSEIRSAAREAGCTVGYLRKVMNENF